MLRFPVKFKSILVDRVAEENEDTFFVDSCYEIMKMSCQIVVVVIHLAFQQKNLSVLQDFSQHLCSLLKL